jgi:hypothetical protein
MRERTQGLSRRGFCASMLSAAVGIAAAGAQAGLAPILHHRRASLPLSPCSSFPTGSAGESPHPPTRFEGAVAADGRGRSIWDTFCERPARSLMAARGRWRATTITGGSPILT